ncbi:endospore germination permease [Cohnella thailandensis]|uniref:Endospore germination permease n=1 Tax=Cohnella thailandensis TaxID=557557 RepID=A0A841SXN9_9BACL|nr:endospore germination permease [Cohnella thailandensis]MBB6637003.1 endospore germination permease [Cohnella thailandensis]MBP1973113.1 spore germination protein (amino acid permease) [Cohnella thailandensis]
MEYELIRIGRVPCIMMILLSIGLMNHVMIAPMVLNQAGRDSWLAVILTAALLPLWILLFRPVIRAIGTQALPAWLEERAGKAAKGIVIAVLCALLAMIAIPTALDTVQWAESMYLPNTPPFALSFVLAALCAIGAVLGIHVIAYVSCLLLPVVSTLGFFVSGANMHRKDYSQLLPILEHGWSPVLSGMVMVAGGFIELSLFALFQGYVDKPFRTHHLFVTAGIVVILTLGPIIGILTEFGPYEAVIQRYPAFIQWRLVQIGKYFEHVDFFAMFQWISGSYVRTACSMALIMDLLAIKNRIKRGILGGVIGIVIVVMSIIPFDDSIEYRFYERYTPIMLCVFLGLMLLLALIAAFGRKGETSHDASNGA